ncbi:MAG: hypothetical protein IPJ27_11685 [Candidatus Accumulibacter sp.]|uniref:Uncharacterized protein n=1 Tax=Candidatus Accumulibacter proximus TaxID=2954385 RepID=A0A935Q0A2_9PROT|nr:hypothetical protein [Candidatus Accumulibacter proximus]
MKIPIVDDEPAIFDTLRYWARPTFALERLREIDAEHLVYGGIKPAPRGAGA